MAETTQYVAVASASVIAQFELQDFPDERVETAVGKAVYEREGVEDRRGYVAHEFTEEGLRIVRDYLESAGLLDRVDFRHTVPGDWRWEDAL